MPEWSIGPHSKCGVRATVPGVRIPLFPQKNEARRCRRISASFCFVTLRHANLFVRRSGMKTKVVDLSTPCGVRILQGAPRRAKGKTSRHEVATKSIPLFPLNKAYKKLIINLVGFFYAQKDAPKMHRPHFYALLRAFFKSHISHTTHPILLACLTAQNGACNFSAVFVKKMHEKRESLCSSLLKMSLHQHSPFLISDSKIWFHCPYVVSI